MAVLVERLRQHLAANVQLLAKPERIFSWVRLAQRVPAASLDHVPAAIWLVTGRTATIVGVSAARR